MLAQEKSRSSTQGEKQATQKGCCHKKTLELTNEDTPSLDEMTQLNLLCIQAKLIMLI